MGIVYFDGHFLPEEEAKVSVLDRGYLSGDGAFTTLQIHNGVVLFLKLHIERLKLQCEKINLICPEISEEWISELIEKNQAFEGTWKVKIVLSRGEDFSMSLPKTIAKHLLIFLKPFKEIPYKPLKTCVFPIPVSTGHATIKSLSHLNRFYIMEYAKQQQCDDAITLTEGGLLLECSFANFLWKEGNTVYTPSKHLPYYFGVTLTMMLNAAQNLGYDVNYVEKKFDELSDEVFLYRCNTMTALRPIEIINDKQWKRDEAFESKMNEEYQKLVSSDSLHCFQCANQ